jgi:hypothetical protein
MRVLAILEIIMAADGARVGSAAHAPQRKEVQEVRAHPRLVTTCRADGVRARRGAGGIERPAGICGAACAGLVSHTAHKR